MSYNNLSWTAGASGTIDYRQDSIALLPPTAANNTLLINALIAGFLNVQFRCAPGTVTGPDPGVITLIDPAASFDSTLIALPSVTDASMDAIVSGPTRTAAGDKTVVAKVTNLGTGNLVVCDTDISWDIEVNNVDTTGSVSPLNPGCKTLSPGGSARFRFRWTFGSGEVSAGVTVDYTATVAAASDANAGNDTDTETRTAN